MKVRVEQEDELRGAEAELRRTLARREADLERTTRALEAFSYAVSHDLRGPLHSILGFTELFEEDNRHRLPPDALEDLERIRAAAVRMETLIRALGELARMERAALTPVGVDLVPLARDVIAGLSTREPGRVVEVRVPGHLEVTADPVLIRLVLQHLLGNAWKFTGGVSDARVELGAVVREGRVACYVRDNGVGFDSARAEHLFEPFRRFHRESEFPGPGIGLAVARRIVERHGGAMEAESVAGAGATFFFTLDPG